MIFCNPFLNFNFFSGFAFGNYLGNRLNNAIWGKPNPGYVTNPFYCCASGFQFMPVFPKQTFYMSDMNFMPSPALYDFNTNNFGNFDTFSYSGGGVSSYGGWFYPPQTGTDDAPKADLPEADATKNNKSIDPLDNITFKYATMTKDDAEKAAKKDSNLEKLTGGDNWIVNSDSFENDIPYARKGTKKLLDQVCDDPNVKAVLDEIYNNRGDNSGKLVVTSALGTSNSKHKRTSSQASHYNELNPKLDFGGQLSISDTKKLANALYSTGLFSRAAAEPHKDGQTGHVDAQFSEEAYASRNL